MGHFLNFGAGPNQLPEPWQNLNAGHDIRKRLQFADGSAQAILCEHVIEHVPFLQGFGFLLECMRVLERGGVLRLAFPDVSRFMTGTRFQEWTPELVQYAASVQQRPGGDVIRKCGNVDEKQRAALLLLLTGWQHQSMWTCDGAAGALFAAGFSQVQVREYGKGDLAGVDGHHKDVGEEIAELETSILEAVK